MKNITRLILVSWWVSTGGLIGQTNVTESNAPAAAKDTNEVTPLTLPGAETFVFKKAGETELRLHVVKPEGWAATDTRPCLVAFFGGGWSSGTPAKSISYAKWAAKYGLVGVAPDYRTRKRFDAKPEDCVADGRAAVRWVQDHSKELGIDPAKVVVQGASAGGHATVKYANSEEFQAKMKANGNRCEMIPFPDAPHSPNSSKEGEKGKAVKAKISEESLKFLEDLGLVEKAKADLVKPENDPE